VVEEGPGADEESELPSPSLPLLLCVSSVDVDEVALTKEGEEEGALGSGVEGLEGGAPAEEVELVRDFSLRSDAVTPLLVRSSFRFLDAIGVLRSSARDNRLGEG